MALSRLWLLAALLACSAGRAAPLTLELKREVVVGHPLVLLGDLATVDTGDAALRRAVEQVVVGKAPLVGFVEQRSRAFLAALLRGQALPGAASVDWRGAERVAYQAQSQRLDAAAVLAAARQQVLDSLEAGYERVEVAPASALPELAAPSGAVEFRARPLEKGPLRQRTPVWVDVLVQGQVYRSIVVPLAVRAYRTVYVARQDLAAGDPAGAAAFALQQEEVGGLPAAPLAAGALQGHSRMRRPLARGKVLGAQDLLPEGWVLHGDRVRLVAQGGGIEVEVAAVAQADAGPGQPVLVRPERSKETVTATVLASDLVRIDGR